MFVDRCWENTPVCKECSVLVRVACPEDVESLVELRRHLLDEGPGHYVARTDGERREWRTQYREWLNAHLGRAEDVHVAVAQTGADVLGCGIAIIDKRVPMAGCLNGRAGWVQTVIVDPAHRGKGIGEAIMAHLMDWLSSNDVGKVALQTTPVATRLYEKLGFAASGEDLLVKELQPPFTLTGQHR